MKGREMRIPDEARTLLPSKSRSAQLGRAAIGPRFRLVRTFDLAPLPTWVRLYLWTEGLPRRGYRTQPRVLTLGTLKINGSP